MKTTKRTFGKLLALALVFLFALTAVVGVLAENENPNKENLTITIHNNEGLPAMRADQFGVYQLFKGTPYREGNVSGTPEWDAKEWNNWTLADIEWGASVPGDGAALLAALKALDPETDTWIGTENPFTTAATAADVAAVLEDHKDNKFMQGFADFLMKKGNLTDLKLTGTLEGAGATQTLTYNLSTNGPGYYIFQDKNNPATSDVVSEYIIAVMGTQDIDLKASIPTVDKEIVNSSNNNKGDVAGVGDYVQFKLTGTLPQNYGDFDTYKYIFHDTLSKGLTYVNDTAHPLTVKVYANKGDADTDEGGIVVTVNTDYTVATSGTTDGCNLEVSFADLKTVKNGEDAFVTAQSVIVVTYYAQVNDDAVIGSAGNSNTVYLEYSNDPHDDSTGKTKEKTVYVYAFGLDLTKVGDDAAHATGLSGAGFMLKKGTGADTKYAIFENQWILNVTTTVTEGEGATESKTQEFFDTEEAAKAAEETAKESESADTTVNTSVEGPVRRLTGWANAADVKKWIDIYNDAVKALQNASNDEKDEKQAAVAVAKTALSYYLLESGVNGKIPDIYGLDEGEYALEEVITPDGYNTMDDFDIKIEAEIDGDGHLTKVTYKHSEETVEYYPNASNYTGSELDEGEIGDLVARFSSGLLKDELVNQKAPFLPFTGGIGTMIFYVLGTLLIAGAITYLVIATKKRKSAE